MSKEKDIIPRYGTGLFKLFWNNGNTMAIGKAIGNSKVGLWKYYYENGELEEIEYHIK